MYSAQHNVRCLIRKKEKLFSSHFYCPRLPFVCWCGTVHLPYSDLVIKWYCALPFSFSPASLLLTSPPSHYTQPCGPEGIVIPQSSLKYTYFKKTFPLDLNTVNSGLHKATSCHRIYSSPTLRSSSFIPFIVTLSAVGETKPRASSHTELCCYNWVLFASVLLSHKIHTFVISDGDIALLQAE